MKCKFKVFLKVITDCSVDGNISRFADYPLVLTVCTTISITEILNPKMAISNFLLSDPFIQEPMVSQQLLIVISNKESSQLL